MQIFFNGIAKMVSATRGLTVFTGAYLLAAAVASYALGNREFVFYLGVMAVLIALVAWVHCRVGLSMRLLWALSLWGLAHMAGGLVSLPEGWLFEGEQAVLYNAWLIPEKLKYDQVVHAYGFGVTTWLCWEGLRAAVASLGPVALRPTLGVLTLCAAAGMGFGALNEVVEFAAVLCLPNTNVGGYINTGWDLVANLVGCVAAAVLLRVTQSEAGS